MARVDALLDDLLELPAAQRLDALAAANVDDPVVLEEVASLLRASKGVVGFLQQPAHVAVQDPDADIDVGSRLGAWQIVRLLGRGGMGVVYEALRAQGDFEQRVAIKLLQPEAASQLDRFQAERQILARLEHPGIARLYDGGVTSGGRPYMVMELIAGVPITDFCARSAASLEQRLQLFIQVCAAVAFAHRNLIVHRDLKPSNILVSDDGQVKLLDFGIAKLMNANHTQITQASVPMTPICAAPEQLTGDPVTTATDVYALGLLLFELLTGTHPWVAMNTPVLQALRTVLQRPAPAASEAALKNATSPVAASAIRGDLDAIIAKALRAEPIHRYATVEALKLDIERVLRSDPVEARAGVRLYVLGRNLRRYRWGVGAGAAILLSLAGGLGMAAWQAQRAAMERDIARRDAAREEAVRYSLTRMFRAGIADHGSEPASAKGMIDKSAQRVLREYRDQPQLQGELVLTLADLYGALEDVDGSGSLLEGFLAEATPEADPAVLADARQKLANIELLRGHTDRAASLLDGADRYWRETPRGYAEEKLEGLTVRARLQRIRGDLEASVATTRSAIAQRIALSGHDHRETAILFNTLAFSLAAAGRLDEAVAANHEATAIYRSLGLQDGLDAQVVLANTGALELRMGHIHAAEGLLKTAYENQRALAGDSAAVAAAMGYYGKVLSITDRNAQAMTVLRTATDMGARFAGSASPVALQNRLFLAEAQLAAADRQAASATLVAVRDAALAQYGPQHLLTLRAQLAMAQVQAAGGDYAAAQAQLLPLVAAVRKMGPPSFGTLAQALAALGDVQTHLGQSAQACVTLQESVSLLERSPNPTWELALARERLGEAMAKSGNTAASDMLHKAEQGLQSQLGPDHPQTRRAKAALLLLKG
jgi:non-specific serine/threonine protein kinase/serine/threonine-protein kinase